MHPTNQNEARPAALQILALDGGGLRGVFAAAALAVWEEDFDTKIEEHFDLVTGTSTGGIIALGLGLGLRPRQILSLYTENADRIFPPYRRRPLISIQWARRPKYSSQALRQLLIEQFGDLTLGASRVRLAIPSYDLATDDVHLFRTPHHVDLRRDWRELAVDVAMATAAAPAYLPVAAVRAHRLIDGGVWANNPSLVGIAEAVDRLHGSLGAIKVVNVGTATELKDRDTRLDRGGVWSWRRDALEIMLRGQSLAATNHARLLVGRTNFVRVDVPVPAGRHLLDSVDTMDLIAKAEGASRFMSPAVADLLDHCPVKYTPLHTKESQDGRQ